MDFDYNQFVAADYETSGTLPEYALQPWRLPKGDFWATSLAWVWRDQGALNVGGGLFPTRLTMAELCGFCLDTKRTLLGWNLAFDISVLLAYGFEKAVNQMTFFDGMLAWRHLEVEPEYDMTAMRKQSFSLKTAVPRFLPQHAGYEAEIDYHSTDPAELAKLHEYNVKDNLFALRVSQMVYNKLTDGQRRAFWIEQSCLPMVAAANLRGFTIDTFVAREAGERMKRVAAARLASLAPHGVTETIVRSPAKLGRLIFDEWKLPVLKHNRSKKKVDENGNPVTTRSTDKAVLFELAFQDPRAKELREFREALNLKTKFCDAVVNAVEYCGDGKAHPMARVFGTYSGRLTYSSTQGRNKDARQIGWALHQTKRGAEFRRALVAPPGFTIVEADAAGQEFKWMAIASRDATMLGLCRPGEDAHSFMTARIRREDYQKFLRDYRGDDKVVAEQRSDQRKSGKLANLALQYRTSAWKLCETARVDYELLITPDEAQVIWSTYRTTYPQVPIYWQTQIDLTRARGYVETFAGRRVKVVGDWTRHGWEMGSTAINYRIQGTGADQKYLALRVLKDYLPTIGAYFIFDLHDGIYMAIPDDKVLSACARIKDLLDHLPYETAWGYHPPIPLDFDVKYGKAWGELVGFKG